MCLNYLNKLPQPEDDIGYKVFIKYSEDRYGTPIKDKNRRYKKEKWYTDKSELTGIYTDRHWRAYKTGYHVFYKEIDARDFCAPGERPTICKVKVKDIVATGYQNSARVMVCKKIRILNECL